MSYIPDLLKSGDRVAIVATARKVSAVELAPAVQLLESWGLEVLLPKNIYAESGQFAGDDGQRAADMQWALDRKDIKAVFCARGGYGTVRIIDSLDFKGFMKAPKWIVGYSDVTVLHSHINRQLGVATLHATMPINIPKDAGRVAYPSVKSLHNILFEGWVEYLFPRGLSVGEVENVTSLDVTAPIVGAAGEAPAYHAGFTSFEVNAPIVGGNLSILYSLCGSASDISTEGSILMIEDLDEYLYHIDRMMQNMRRTGKLDCLKGLVIGGMTDMHDNAIPFGMNAEKIVSEAVKGFDYPVCFNAPFGHIGTENRAIALGAMVSLKGNGDGSFCLRQVLR